MDSNLKVQPPTLEGIDFNKLKVVLYKNWLWLTLLFILINLTAYLSVRYTKNIYESESIIKLDVKTEASSLGITGFMNESNSNLISGEIEVIQSKLFLSRVLDFAHIEVDCYSIGRVLNSDLFNNPPVFVKYTIRDNSILNTPIYYDPTSADGFTLKAGDHGEEIKGQYGKKISLPEVDLMLTKNKSFIKGSEIGYYILINSEDALLNNLSKNLVVEPLNFNAKTIRVSLKDSNPFKAKTILSIVDSLYLQYSYEQKNLANKQKIDWLTNELRQIEKKMEDYEDYFEGFTLQNKTNDLEQDLSKTIAAINQIDTQRFNVTKRIEEVNQLIDTLNSGNLSFSSAYQYNLPAYLGKSIEEIQQLYLQQEKLKLSYNEPTFAYRQKQRAIEALVKKISLQLEETKKSNLLRLRDLNKKKQKLEDDFAKMPDRNTLFSKNKRFYKLYEELYLLMMHSKSEFEIAQAGSTPDFKILSSATIPKNAISPKRLMIAGIGAVLSLFICLLLIGTLYLLNNRITNIYELEKITELVPLLGIVPAMHRTVTYGLYVKEYPKSMVSESFRTLRTNLDFFGAKIPKKIIALSSTVSGEGKSFVAMNLGAVIAMSNKKVILLDLDMRKPKNTALPIKLDDFSKGMSTILIHKHTWNECVTNTSIENFDYIPSGPHPPNPSELLLSDEFTKLMDELKKSYDFILLDTPPVGLVTDGIMAMKRADISIYIFKATYSKKEFIKTMMRTISANKFSNVVMLLNALPSISYKGFGYGYYEEPKTSFNIKSIFKRS